MKYAPNLLQYSAAACAFIALSNDADAQIVGKNFTPNRTFSISDAMLTSASPFGTTYSEELDLDRDGLADFQVELWAQHDSYGTDWRFKAIGLNGLELAYIRTACTSFAGYLHDWIHPFGLGASIGGSWADWENEVVMAHRFGVPCGPMLNRTRHIGFRVPTSAAGSYNYGWLKIGVSTSSGGVAFKAYGYAAEATPDTPINAGATPGPVPLRKGRFENNTAR